MINRFAVAALSALLLSGSAIAGELVGDVAAGERLYRDGIKLDGSIVSAEISSGVEVEGEQFACASCHRPSGYGASEGGTYVPPISGQLLFQERIYSRAENLQELYRERQTKEYFSRVRSTRNRPAYDDASLATVIRTGVDANGRQLETVMPRYALNDQDMANLIAYLRNLGADDPGVDEREIHFAFVIAGDVEHQQLLSIDDVVRRYFDWRNISISDHLTAKKFSLNYKGTYLQHSRYWNISYWKLEGETETWSDQLRDYYDDKPVFAILGGVGGPWDPIEAFCEKQQLPCIFPFTQLPETTQDSHYTVYFNRGLELEADVVAQSLTFGEINNNAAIGQIYRDTETGRRPAQRLRSALSAKGWALAVDHKLAAESDLMEVLITLKKNHPDIASWVVWPDTQDLDLLDESIGAGGGKTYLPSTALHLHAEQFAENDNLIFVHPYALPSTYQPRSFRVRGWMHSRGVTILDELSQNRMFYIFELTRTALEVILGSFNREYFLERIEHEAENNLDISYVNLALGPGQRFASKGAYLVKIDPQAKGGISAVSDWIVP